MTLMKHNNSASVQVTCRYWRANDFALLNFDTGKSLPCFGAVSARTFEILASGFPTQFTLLEMSVEVDFRWIHWIGLSACTALILVLLWAFCCCGIGMHV